MKVLPSRLKTFRVAGVAPILFLSSTLALAGPITFNTALPVAKRDGILRVQYFRFQATDDPTALNRNVSVNAVPIVLGYGATPRLALFGIVPIQRNSLEVNTPMGRVERSVSGFGDILFIARYTAYQLDRHGSTIRLAPFGGIKFPTGRHDDSDRFGTIPRPIQLGSGSWDALAGAVFTWQTFQWEFDADAGYRKNTRHDAFRFGNQTFLDASFQYRVWPGKLGAKGVPHFLFAVLETNLTHDQKNESAGLSDPTTGGTNWHIDPGLQYVTPDYIIEAVVQIPAAQRLHGTALREDYRVSVGFRWNFAFPGF